MQASWHVMLLGALATLCLAWQAVASNAVLSRLSQELIFLTPNAGYDLNSPAKYMAAAATFVPMSVPECNQAFDSRKYLMPTKITFTLSQPKPTVKLAKSPFAVVTSNRAKFIKSQLERPTPRLMFDPRRTNNRAVFVFVGGWEFDVYNRELAGFPQVTVVGCSVKDSLVHDDYAQARFHGFGLNRYCANAFFQLNTIADKYWMVDDNLVHISRMAPAGVATSSADYVTRIDKMMDAAETQVDTSAYAAATWPGIKQLEDTEEVTDIAAPLNYDGVQQQAMVDFQPFVDYNPKKHIFQQAYILHVARLAGTAFSPLFVLSKEDISFADILGPGHVGWFAGGGIFKLRVALYDNEVIFDRQFDLLEKQAKNDQHYPTTVAYSSASSLRWADIETQNWKVGTGTAEVKSTALTKVAGTGTRFTTEFAGKHFIRLEIRIGNAAPSVSTFRILRVDSDTEITIQDDGPNYPAPTAAVGARPVFIPDGPEVLPQAVNGNWNNEAIATFARKKDRSVQQMLTDLKWKVPVFMTGIDDATTKGTAAHGSEPWLKTAIKAVEEVMSKCARWRFLNMNHNDAALITFTQYFKVPTDGSLVGTVKVKSFAEVTRCKQYTDKPTCESHQCSWKVKTAGTCVPA